MTLPDTTVRVYSFDLDSNRTQIQENGQTTATYAYDPTKLDQLQSVTQGGTTTYGYDGDGNTTGRGSDTLSWDGRGRHSGGTFSGTAVSYGFDASGFRRTRTGGSQTTNYRLSGLYETSSQGTITNTDTAGPSGDLAHYAGPPTTGSTVSFLYYSGHGDLAAEADSAGTRTAAYTYDPFGQLRSGSAPQSATSERWTGRFDKKLDSSSSLVEMGARPYDPAIGRFLALDPVEGGSLTDYDFAGMDPLNAYDLDGDCYKGSGLLNFEVKGSRRWLCLLVVELAATCIDNKYYSGIDPDNVDRRYAYCYNWAGQYIRSNISTSWEDLWQDENLGSGPSFNVTKLLTLACGIEEFRTVKDILTNPGRGLKVFLRKSTLLTVGCIARDFVR